MNRISGAILFVVALTGSLTAWAAAVRAQEVPDAAREAALTELKRLQGILTRPESSYANREDAAAMLVARMPDSAEILTAALENVEVLDVPLAVLVAITEQTAPNAAFLPGLYKLAASDTLKPKVAEALPAALAVYREKGQVEELLRRVRASEAAGEKTILITALGVTGEKDAVAPLIELLKNDEATVREAAGRALARITFIDSFGTSHEKWSRWWQEHGRQPREMWLALQLEALRTQAKTMRVQIQDQSQTIAALTKRLVDTYQKALQAMDPKDTVGRAAKVKELLDDPLAQLRFLAAAEARKLLADDKAQDPALIEKLLSRVEDEAPGVRGQVAGALAAAGGKKPSEVLLKRLDAESDLSARAAVIDALGELREPLAVPGLVKVLEGSDESLIVHAAGALAQIGERGTATADAVAPAIKPLCTLAVGNGEAATSPVVREAVVRALARIGRQGTLDTLVKAIDDAVATVRFYAAQGLGNLPESRPQAVDALLAHLADADKGVRTAVANTLGRLGDGRASRDIAVRLIPASGEKDAEVRSALWRALLTIQKRETDPAVAESLADGFTGYDDSSLLDGAAKLYELAVEKYGAGGSGNGRLEKLKLKLADVYVRTDQGGRAAEVLQELLNNAGDDPARQAVIRRKLGQALLYVPPFAKGAEMLASLARKAEPAERDALLRIIHDRAQQLQTAGKAAEAHEVLSAARRILSPKWADSTEAARLETLLLTAARALFDRSVADLSAEDEAVRRAAATTVDRLSGELPDLLLGRLQAALEAGNTDLATQLEEFLPSAREDVSGYTAAATAEEKLTVVRRWRTQQPGAGG